MQGPRTAAQFNFGDCALFELNLGRSSSFRDCLAEEFSEAGIVSDHDDGFMFAVVRQHLLKLFERSFGTERIFSVHGILERQFVGDQ